MHTNMHTNISSDEALALVRGIEALRDLPAPPRVYVAATGAGAGIQNTLWRVPGCSSFLVGTAFPYAKADTDEFLGYELESYCSAEAAVAFATEAYRRAVVGGEGPAIGLGVVAAVGTIRKLKGGSRFHIAVMTDEGCSVLTHNIVTAHESYGTLPEAGYWRRIHGDKCDRKALRVLLETAGVLEEREALNDAQALATDLLFAHPYFRADRVRTQEPQPCDLTVFPGAFNPPHAGHFGMVDEVERGNHSNRNNSVAFHITADPPHKAALTVQELLRRLPALRGRNVLFSRGDALYIDKARRRPSCCIIIGADALDRTMDPSWGPAIEPMIQEFRSLFVRFLVFGRNGERASVLIKSVTSKYDAENIGWSDRGFNVFQPFEGEWDASSTAIRNGQDVKAAVG